MLVEPAQQTVRQFDQHLPQRGVAGRPTRSVGARQPSVGLPGAAAGVAWRYAAEPGQLFSCIEAVEPPHLRTQSGGGDQPHASQLEQACHNRIVLDCRPNLRFDPRDAAGERSEFRDVIFHDPAVRLRPLGAIDQPGEPRFSPGLRLGVFQSIFPQQRADTQLDIFAATNELGSMPHQPS